MMLPLCSLICNASTLVSAKISSLGIFQSNCFINPFFILKCYILPENIELLKDVSVNACNIFLLCAFIRFTSEGRQEECSGKSSLVVLEIRNLPVIIR